MNTFFDRESYRSVTLMGLPAMIAAASIFVVACASTPPPTDEVAVSAAAVTHAVGAGAPELAPMEMRAAREKLDRAKAAMATKDYDVALSLAQQAQVDAQLAEAKAHSIKARKAADALQEDTRVLREELNRKTK